MEMSPNPVHSAVEGAASLPPAELNAAINLRLALLGLPVVGGDQVIALVEPILARQRELNRRLADRLCPVDTRIQGFLNDFLAATGPVPSLPRRTLVLDQPGLARGLSLPANGDCFKSSLLSSYRLRNGVLHNPANDRRTTAGVFHVVEGGLPIPDDKLAVPKAVFAKLLALAMNPPAESLQLPFATDEPSPAESFVSLLMRPLVVPAVPGVPGFASEKRMEIRFFVPGALVSNLDFVESIFGNAGDPYLPENDASLDPDGWTGHTGCVILAPHLTQVPKRLLGLPHWDMATERQRRDGMCYKDESELYNGGNAFKVCARDGRGVIVTLIADNYFGYCKKEVKTQISYSANLFGLSEEEHAGGALVFPSYNEGLEYTDLSAGETHSLQDVLARDGERFVLQPEGHALDPLQPHIVLVPENSTYSLRTQTVSWPRPDGTTSSIKMLAGKTYIGPNGFRMEMQPLPTDSRRWGLVAASAEVTACHKPSTVSGGGKSEISKAISDAILVGSVFVADLEKDMDAVEAILERDFSGRFRDPARNGVDHRPVLGIERSMGSVIKLMTPSSDFNDDYNAWLKTIPQHVKELVFVVKRYYRPEWGGDWRSHYSVDIINGRPANSLRLDGTKLLINTLRVGFEMDGSWRVFGLRHDFHPACKVQTEDDITASVVVPPSLEVEGALSRKFVQNCEQRLFQRPDDAIHRGYDRQAEADIATPGTFISNFAPLDGNDARELVEDAIGFSAFTVPMQNLISAAAEAPEGSSPAYFVSSAHPRLVGGKPSKNPRYLQLRPDVARPRETATAELAMRLFRKLPADAPLCTPVHVVAAGRRNNPPEEGVRPLCTYNPLHYMELPELFMEFISSMTGKSPSTTGAGSEGALTKGPFNALPAIIDLNAAFVSFALTGYDGWVSSAGYIGPHVRVDHDVSLLVPEVFARMNPEERSAQNLIAMGALERIADFEHRGQTVLASRLGYRMTARFASVYFGRIFLHPHVVFTEEMLRPERQDKDVFAESMANIVVTHQRVAESYFADGTIELACPPLKALLEIMAYGKTAAGYGLQSPEVRTLFTRESVLASDWYAARLDAKQRNDEARLSRAVASLYDFIDRPENAGAVARLGLVARREGVQAERVRVGSAEYRASLVGTIGVQPLGEGVGAV